MEIQEQVLNAGRKERKELKLLADAKDEQVKEAKAKFDAARGL